MRSAFSSLLGYFLNPAGLVVLGALDSSLIFFLPLGIDVVLILLSARNPEMFWLYAICATAGSVVGAAATYFIGRTVGETGLARLVGKAQLQRVQHRVSDTAAAGVAVLGLIPPPFPFTALVLGSGAFGLNAWKFLTTLAGVRAARFGIEAALAAKHGERILTWMDSPVFEVLIGLLIVLAVTGTIFSAVKLIRAR